MSTQTPWLHIAIDDLAAGVHEAKGFDDRIAEAQRLVGLTPDDETPWCSAYANLAMKNAGIVGSMKPNARSWLSWGQELRAAEIGAVTVLWRGSPEGWLGHVAFYLGHNGPGEVILLGGNQADAVSVECFPLTRVLGFRWPTSLATLTT